MIQYDSFKVVGTDASTATMLLEWHSSSNAEVTLLRNHAIPLEAEQNEWTEEQYRKYFLTEVSDVPSVPEWATEEVTAELIARKGLPL